MKDKSFHIQHTGMQSIQNVQKKDCVNYPFQCCENVTEIPNFFYLVVQIFKFCNSFINRINASAI